MTTPRPGAAGAREQVARMLALVPYLNARGSVHVDEAARDLGVSSAQIVRDLRVLFLCGLPGGFPDDLIDVDISALTEAGGDRIIRMSNADYLSRPLRLSPTEASALVVALRVLRAGGGLDAATRASVDSALEKLQGALGADGAGIEPGETSEREAALEADWARIEAALGTGRQVALTYHVPARDELVARTVDPWALVRRGGAAYLEAWCHLAGGSRSFRLDRMHDVRVLETPVVHPVPPADDEADDDTVEADAAGRDAVTGMPGVGAGGVLATLRLAPGARWVPDYYRTAAVRPAEDGSAEIDMWVADLRWLERFVLRLAPDVAVLAPDGVTGSVTAKAQRTLNLY